MNYTENNPWIKEREANLCTWKMDYNRGYFNNMATSLLVDFMSLSNRQIAEYVKMIKACGFTGIQVTDMVSAWRPSGSWENVHDKYKVLSDELHKNGMKFTVWCWAAQFCGHGWFDNEVVYRSSDPGVAPYDDPKVFAAFNKYYDIYADLAPYADRVIAHFYDPGQICDIYSVVKFIGLLAEKFRSRNPDIQIAVDTWGSSPSFPTNLINAGMKDIMLMELPFLPEWRQEGKRATFRQGVQKLGCDLGSWGWYTCEYEIDQLPIMIVNNRVLADVYRQTREQGDHVMAPSYWSEMDSYHILNFFSLYAAGHLLINPDEDPDKLLYDSALAITGFSSPENTSILLDALTLIRDTRSGDTWDTYWWTEDKYILYHGDYTDIPQRADTVISRFKTLIEQPEPEDGISFPIKRKDLYRLMLPHLLQIRQFAQFRCDLNELKNLAEKGTDPSILQDKVNRLPFKIPEYNCVVGEFGQPECRMAILMLDEFCTKYSLEFPDYDLYQFKLKRRIYDTMMTHQRGASQPIFVGRYSFGVTKRLTDKAVDEMIADHILFCEPENNRIALVNWEEFSTDFNI